MGRPDYSHADDSELLALTASDPEAFARHELADTWQRGRVEDRARRRMQVAPQMLTDEALERVEEVASRASRDALELLESLPQDQRLAVNGRVLHELDYGELAASLSCSQSLVRQRVSRGLKALRVRLKETT
jgi:RNA polymerase sigma-70 factor (ECF subfamily)